MPKTLKDELYDALKALAFGMDRAGGDAHGMPECPWCKAGPDGDDHRGDCELAQAREVLAKVDALLHSSEGPQETNDHGAALLPVEPSAAVETEPLPNRTVTVERFIHWCETTPNQSLTGNSRVAYDAQIRVLRQLAWYLEGTDDYLITAVNWNWENKPRVGSGTQPLSEASGPNAQERERKNTHSQTAAEGRETPDLQRGER
jgi:hypothetical protein